MIVGVKEKLKENEIIYFWGKLLRNCRKSDFRQLVMKYSGADIVCVNKLTPVICWTGEWNYKEEKLVNGTNNVYEYYFQQPSNIAEADINRCRNVVNSSGGAEIY